MGGYNSMKKVLKLFVVCNLFLFLFCLTSCVSTGDLMGNNPTSNSTVETMKKHTVRLTMDNYQTYIEIRGISGESATTFNFEGALSYAYYDNVVISYKVNGEPRETKLNAGGYGRYYSSLRMASSTAEIIGVSGSVIYWM
jgi:hypothetical protein